MDSLRAEKRSARDTAPHIVQRHLQEVAEKERQLSSLQVRLFLCQVPHSKPVRSPFAPL